MGFKTLHPIASSSQLASGAATPKACHPERGRTPESKDPEEVGEPMPLQSIFTIAGYTKTLSPTEVCHPERGRTPESKDPEEVGEAMQLQSIFTIAGLDKNSVTSSAARRGGRSRGAMPLFF